MYLLIFFKNPFILRWTVLSRTIGTGFYFRNVTDSGPWFGFSLVWSWVLCVVQVKEQHSFLLKGILKRITDKIQSTPCLTAARWTCGRVGWWVKRVWQLGSTTGFSSLLQRFRPSAASCDPLTPQLPVPPELRESLKPRFPCVCFPHLSSSPGPHCIQPLKHFLSWALSSW